MPASHYEAERCVHERRRRPWELSLLAGAVICWALTGVMATGMLVEARDPYSMGTCDPVDAVSCREAEPATWEVPTNC